MVSPIADKFTSSRHTSSLSVASAPSAPVSAEPSLTRRYADRRATVSIKPGEDPFASNSDFAVTLESQPLGGEEWRISEESSSMSAAEEGGPGLAPPKSHKVERRPSFLKSLLNGTRRSRSSINLSISNPIVSDDPPRVGPIRTSGSLVSIRHSFAASSPPGSLRASSPATTTTPPTLSHAFSSGSLSTRRTSEPVAVPVSSVEVPPTTSGKAFNILGGPRVTPQNQKAVERLTGFRTSLYTDEDRMAGFGIAISHDITHDGTRYISADNRLSVLSNTTSYVSSATGTSVSSSDGGRNRDTMHSGYAPSAPLSVHEEDDEYDPAAENGDGTSVHRTRGSGSLRRQPSSPPPRGPVPPVPTFSFVDTTRSPRSSSVYSRSTGAHDPAPPVPPLPSLRTAPVSSSPLDNPHPKSWLRRTPSKTRSTSSLPLPKTSRPSTGTSGTLAKPVACVYLVAGLPKNPATWSLSDHADSGSPPAHSLNAVQRFWRPEVLASTVTGEVAGDEVHTLEGERVKGKGKAGRKQKEQPRQELVTLSKEEISRIQGKAMKLAFTRDVEILATTVQPPSTLSTFSFQIPRAQAIKAPGLAGATAQAWDSALDPRSTTAPIGETTFYASCLVVWSHADENRSNAIRATLAGGATAKSQAIHQAVKAASAGKRLGAKLARQMSSPLGAIIQEGRGYGRGVVSDTEAETDGGLVTESEWGDSAAVVRPLAPLPDSVPFWLPFGLLLISEFPLYNLLSDVLRISWARYHQDIAQHSLHMRNILNFPAPRPGNKIQLPVSASSAQANTNFVATMPGKIDWAAGAQDGDANFIFWPIFRALDADNLLTIAEVALSPLGRVLFISSYPVMLGIATSVFTYILEQRGWRGVVHPTVHTRDLRIFIEDPGPWLIAIPSQSRFIALADLPPEVAVVDLDSNSVRVRSPFPGALSTGSAREKNRRRLADAISNPSPYYITPAELMEAFPAGRFRPFSDVEVDGTPKEAERLRPAASWDYDQQRALSVFDAILKEAPRTTIFAKLFHTKQTRRLPEAEGTLQKIVRKHTSTFVDRRDMLENRINRLNHKLANLMSESADWQRSLEVFQAFSEKLTKESGELKTRLEKERREARRLTGQVGLERVRQQKLEETLRATDTAREQALEQLFEVQAVRNALEQQKNLLMGEMQDLLGADESSPLYEAVFSRLEAISHRSDTSSRPGTSNSFRAESRSHRRASTVEEEEEDLAVHDDELVTEHTGETNDSEEARLEAMKIAVHEAFASIQSRLAIVLHNAGQIEASGSNRTSFNPSLAASSDDLGARIASPTPSSPAIQEEPEDVTGDATPHEPRRFQPKAFRLTPPFNHEGDENSTPGSFHSARASVDDSKAARRTSRTPSSAWHRNQDSVFSITSQASDAQEMTPTTATPGRSFPRHESPDLVRRSSANSFGVVQPRREYESSYPESRQEYDDVDADAESFVSFDDGGFGTPTSGKSFSYGHPSDEEGDKTDGSTNTRHAPLPDEVPSLVEEVPSFERPESPPEGSVELFTRSVKRRSNLAQVAQAMAAQQPSKLPRPVSSVTVKARWHG